MHSGHFITLHRASGYGTHLLLRGTRPRNAPASGVFSSGILRRAFRYPRSLVHYEMDCLRWYVDEVHAMGQAYRKRFPQIRYYEVDIDDLNSGDSVRKMLEFFGCRARDTIDTVIGVPENMKV